MSACAKEEPAYGRYASGSPRDFYQLSPVPNVWTNDDGTYCFRSHVWSALLPHVVVLKEVHRQDNIPFIKAISETGRGCPTPKSISLINSLTEEVPRSTLLYSRRTDVFIANHERLLCIPGEMIVYNSTDNPSISSKMRKSVDVPSKLCVKSGAPVVLTVNMS